MPGKRTEPVEKVDANTMLPDIYENWLKKQKTSSVSAKAGFISDRALGKEDKAIEEDLIDEATAELKREKKRKK